MVNDADVLDEPYNWWVSLISLYSYKPSWYYFSFISSMKKETALAFVTSVISTVLSLPCTKKVAVRLSWRPRVTLPRYWLLMLFIPRSIPFCYEPETVCTNLMKSVLAVKQRVLSVIGHVEVTTVSVASFKPQLFQSWRICPSGNPIGGSHMGLSLW